MVQLELQDARTSAGAAIPSYEQFQRWIDAAFQSPRSAEVVVRIVDIDEITHLNQAFRGKPSATNVLSFPFEAPHGVPLDLLGDIVICASVLETQAEAQGKPLEAHWAHLVVHGLLHLMGFDHIEESDADAMEAREIAVLQGLGYPDPYLE